MTEPSRQPGPRSLAGSVVLGLVAFGATLILLFGLSSVISRTAGDARSTTRPTAMQASPTASGPSMSAGAASTTPTASGDPVLVGAGDIADCGLDSGAATAALLDSIDGTVFTAGDNAYPNGSAENFDDCYDPTWGRHLERTRPAPGNHDWETKDLTGYLAYFGGRAAPDGVSWYSYDLGPWHVIVLDSDCGVVDGCLPDSAQGRWLAADLKASTAGCTLAIWHHPRFSSGEHGNDPSVWPFWDALYRAGADVVVNGHDHDYERFGPQDPAGREDKTAGIRQFVVGTGGAVLRGFPTVAAHSEKRSADSLGVIRLVLHPTSYEWSFIQTAGGVGDEGNGTCH
jgi:acid phosphatase type 7